MDLPLTGSERNGTIFHADGVETIAVLEFIAVGYVYLTISFRFSQWWRAYGYCSTNEYANYDHEYLFVAILNVMCAFSAFLG